MFYFHRLPSVIHDDSSDTWDLGFMADEIEDGDDELLASLLESELVSDASDNEQQVIPLILRSPPQFRVLVFLSFCFTDWIGRWKWWTEAAQEAAIGKGREL